MYLHYNKQSTLPKTIGMHDEAICCTECNRHEIASSQMTLSFFKNLVCIFIKFNPYIIMATEICQLFKKLIDFAR